MNCRRLVRTAEKRDSLWKWYGILSMLSLLGALCCLTWDSLWFGTFFLGTLAVGCAGEAVMLYHAHQSRICRWISRVGNALFLLFVVSFVWISGLIWDGTRPDAAAYDADYVLVLGAHVYEDRPAESLRERLEVALTAMGQSKGIFILCGGQGDDEFRPESHIMYDYLVERGTDPARLQIEDRSRNTIENIAYAKEIIPQGAKTAVITSEFHLARAKQLMEHAGLDAVGLPAPTPYKSLLAVCWMREYCSTLGLIVSARYF